jgi:hypothetical protein
MPRPLAAGIIYSKFLFLQNFGMASLASVCESAPVILVLLFKPFDRNLLQSYRMGSLNNEKKMAVF